MEIGAAEDCPPYPNRRAVACVDRARHSVPSTKDYKPYSPSPTPKILGTAKSTAWAEAWDAALLMAPTWALALVAA